MFQNSKLIATRLIRATAPKGPVDAVFKFAGFMVAIHAVSLCFEWMLTGKFNITHGTRFILTVLSGAPFVALTLYAVGRSYRLHRQLLAMATTDVLTGLPNRRAFVAQMQDRLAQNLPGHLLIVDADHFKQVNDTFGHAVGDLCLQAVADRLRDVTTSQDLLARIGGEEFGIYVRRDPAVVGTLGQQICAAIPVRSDVTEKDLSVTLSAGATRTTGGEGLEQVMRRADDALYHAKQSGRARMTVWDDTSSLVMPPAPVAATATPLTILVEGDPVLRFTTV